MMVLAQAIMLLLWTGWAVSAPNAEKGAPDAPSDLRVSTRFEGAVAVASLRWRDHSDNELGFEILRSDKGAEFRVVGIAGADTVRIEDKVGKYVVGAYAYKVRAFNEVGKSPATKAVNVWF